MALPGDVTRVLRRLDAEDRDAVAELLPLVYDELHALARRYMARERPNHTLQPTALVDEAFVNLTNRSGGSWTDRRHFLRAAAAVMRSILVSHARDRNRMKRGGGAPRVPLDDSAAAVEQRAIDLVALDEALERLAEIGPRQAEIVELRFFGGMTVAEVAETLDVSERTVEADWSLARAWLFREVRKE